jgi:hypothetical protein
VTEGNRSAWKCECDYFNDTSHACTNCGRPPSGYEPEEKFTPEEVRRYVGLTESYQRAIDNQKKSIENLQRIRGELIELCEECIGLLTEVFRMDAEDLRARLRKHQDGG